MRRLIVAAAAALALLTAAEPAFALRDRDGCFEHLSSNSRVIDETRFGIVFRKRDIVYGCIYTTGRIRRLPEQDPLGPPVTEVGVVDLDGRYVAYGIGDEEGGASVLLYDLKTGKRVFTAAPLDEQTANDPNVGPYAFNVRAIITKANGTTAWIGTGSRKVGSEPVPGGGSRDITEPVIEVLRRAPFNTGNEPIDSGPDVEPDSLAKSHDERFMYWRRGGQPQDAALR